ncbi:MAG: hypothetical protein FWD57_01540 [Polyangiaceae bacterium]|nr:hypothetical protein [Polyangiaceae bacterium]
MEPENNQLASAHTAAAILYMLDGPNAQYEDILANIADSNQISSITKPLRSNSRHKRATTLASLLQTITQQIGEWGMS